MSSEPSKGQDIVYLLSTDNFLAGALSYVFEREVCSRCVLLKNGDPAPGPDGHDPDKAHDRVLFLIDCLDRDFEKELLAFSTKDGWRGDAFTAALFNLQKGTGIERRAFKKGIKGFFYRHDSLPQILKGVKSLLQGEIWISRDILAQVALQAHVKRTTVLDKASLTRREAEILVLLSIGSSNDEIADKLFISPNTVKTHLYRVFRKINVPNRFQAALWAAKNL